jgi:HAE1 family hydrophobic/amphiphilic exporter-1
MAILGGGYDVANYSDKIGGGEVYKIHLAAKNEEVTQPSDLSQIYLRSNNQQMNQLIRMDTFAKLESGSGQGLISKNSLQYAATMYVEPKMSLGEAVKFTSEVAKQILPSDYRLLYFGQADTLMETQQVVAITLILAVILVYMVLASQFNSFSQPLIIMVAQPLAIAGALLALLITNTSINVFSMIGFILLMGLVAKNSILLIDLTNQRRKQFKDNINLALLDACPQRLRPVLMTSFTVILAMLPSAVSTGIATKGNAALSIAVIGGMLSSTFLTLIVVPCVYSVVEYQFDTWRKKYVYWQNGIKKIHWRLIFKDFTSRRWSSVTKNN